ncbi:hypothetical protein DK095_640001 [Flavobacterium psychrophilum]|nr:hypothetical protein DK095_640001 [Flavobacterium psychrophilum]
MFLEIAGIKILNADVLRRVRDSSGNPFFEAFRRIKKIVAHSPTRPFREGHAQKIKN